MILVVSTKDRFRSVSYLGCYSLCIDLVGLGLLQALGVFMDGRL